MKGKTLFWLLLAVLYAILAYINYSGYSEINEKVGGLYIGKTKLIVANPSELTEVEKASYVDLSYLLKSSALVNIVGFVLAALAAIISAKW